MQSIAENIEIASNGAVLLDALVSLFFAYVTYRAVKKRAARKQSEQPALAS